VEKIDMTLIQTDKLMKEIIENFAERLLPHAYARIGITDSKPKKKLRVKLGRVKFYQDINAYYDYKNNIITINKELMVFYHKILKVYVSTLNVGIRKTQTMEERKIPPDRILSTCKELMQAYLEKRLREKAGFSLAELGEGQTVILSRLVSNCECFDVGHELGHFVIKNTKGQVAEYSTAKETVEEFLQHVPDLSKEEKLKMAGPWTDEICADLIGLQLLLAQDNRDSYADWENYKNWLCAGVEVSLLLTWMLQEFDNRLNHGNKVILVSTHPYDLLRWEAIRSNSGILRSADTLDIGRHFHEFATWVLEELFSKADNGSYVLKNSY
jgi:hypothetical protein